MIFVRMDRFFFFSEGCLRRIFVLLDIGSSFLEIGFFVLLFFENFGG